MRVRTILFFCLAPFAIGVLPGCGGDDGGPEDQPSTGALGECPPDSAAQQAAGLEALQVNCVACHGTTVSGPSRGGAPPEINVDDPASVSAGAEKILDAIEAGGTAEGMPVGVRLPDDTIESIRVYLACDAAQ
ncbi:c-type cytochrome [Sorangium sp. So ce590]|uniref:c-type cytochrome n=1 Tax=unclassified Sorangium TaxID=2621164 RepID=UPI003F5EC144